MSCCSDLACANLVRIWHVKHEASRHSGATRNARPSTHASFPATDQGSRAHVGQLNELYDSLFINAKYRDIHVQIPLVLSFAWESELQN